MDEDFATHLALDESKSLGGVEPPDNTAFPGTGFEGRFLADRDRRPLARLGLPG